MTITQQRRLLQSCLVSVNGVFSEPLTWAGPHFGAGSAATSLAALQAGGALLKGRGTYEIFSRQWPAASGEYAEYINQMPKYVFSTRLQSPAWGNTTVISGDVAAAVAELKQTAGRDLIVYGHGRFGQTLCDAGLVDQLTLNIAPVFVESGSPFFQPGGIARTWQLVNAGPGADPGLASLTYQPMPESTAGAAGTGDR
jgi:dihydrofolate reductase